MRLALSVALFAMLSEKKSCIFLPKGRLALGVVILGHAQRERHNILSHDGSTLSVAFLGHTQADLRFCKNCAVRCCEHFHPTTHNTTPQQHSKRQPYAIISNIHANVSSASLDLTSIYMDLTQINKIPNFQG